MISMENILEIEDTIRNVDEKGLHQLILKFQRKQPSIFVYLAAVSQREELNDDEQDVFFTTALVLWMALVENSKSVKKVSPKKLNEMDDQLISISEDEKNPTFLNFAEPKLLEYALIRITQPQPEFQIREDLKLLMFAFIKVVLDAMLESRS
jgi:hypothetical protein